MTGVYAHVHMGPHTPACTQIDTHTHTFLLAGTLNQNMAQLHSLTETQIGDIRNRIFPPIMIWQY